MGQLSAVDCSDGGWYCHTRYDSLYEYSQLLVETACVYIRRLPGGCRPQTAGDWFTVDRSWKKVNRRYGTGPWNFGSWMHPLLSAGLYMLLYEPQNTIVVISMISCSSENSQIRLLLEYCRSDLHTNRLKEVSNDDWQSRLCNSTNRLITR